MQAVWYRYCSDDVQAPEHAKDDAPKDQAQEDACSEHEEPSDDGAQDVEPMAGIGDMVKSVFGLFCDKVKDSHSSSSFQEA